ncbi:MAG: ABC transporter substrate-binding protein [Lactobacillus sp.]|jgi:branched-chain amino acid transport system substrate-binding protein|nr:ABC transporter substrate-binding protein [Lactobacillus sp.]
MKKLLLVIAIILAVIACYLYSRNNATTSPDSNKPTIKIGAILPLTGGMSSLGSAGENGARMAIEKSNHNPASRYHYELISDDTITDAKRSIPIFKKMTDFDKVSAIVSFDSQAGHAIKPLANQAQILHISSAADPTVADGNYNFINSSDLNNNIHNLLEYFEKNGYRNIAIAGVNYIASQRVFNILKEQIKDTDFKIVADELVNPTERQIQTEAKKIANSNPDVVFLYGFEPITSLYAKELKNAGYHGPISGIYTLSYTDNPEILNGSTYFDYGSGDDNFKEEYRQRFKLEPNAASTVMFDSINIIINLFETNTSPQQIDQILKNYYGPNGLLILKENGLIHSDLVLVQMTDGKPVPVKE